MKRFSIALILLVLFTTGCGRAGFGFAMFATGMIVASAHHRHHEHVTYVEVSPAPNVIVTESTPPTIIIVPAASPRDEVPPPSPPSFDPITARNALANVDLAKCRDEGAPRIQGHAKVTYVSSGNISKVLIDQPGGLSLAAVTCIGREIGTARVHAFGGASVVVGTSWNVP